MIFSGIFGKRVFGEARGKENFRQKILPAIFLALGFIHPALSGPPSQPRIVDFEALGKEIGRPGGAIEMLMAKPKDIRNMVIYSGARLVTYDHTFSLQPDILARVDNDANKSFTLHIRAGHLWSDGMPFTSEDFRYWWEDIAHNPLVLQGGLPPALLVEGQEPKFEVLDERRVRYSWHKPNPLFLPALAGGRPLYIYQPAHYMKQFHEKYADSARLAETVAEEGVQDWGRLHIRKGRQYRPENPDMPSLQPWVNTTRLPAERLIFKRNPNFHRVDPEGQPLPYIDEVILNIVSKSIIPAKTGTGESHLQGRYLRFDNFAFLKKGAEEGGYNVLLWPSGKGSELTLLPNLNAADPGWRKAFRDVRVRRALSLAIDREEINEAIFFGLAQPGANSVLSSSPLYRDEYALAWTDYDPEQANRLLDEAGYEMRDGKRHLPDGREMEIILETAGESSQETDILQLVADHLSKIGIGFFVKAGQRDILRQRVGTGEVAMSAWEGLNRGLATADMNPEELVPVSSVQGQWPLWGRYFETKGAGGEAPDMEEAQELVRLYQSWKGAESAAEQEKIWHEMLALFTEQVFTIGIVSGGLQPVVVHRDLRNVPKEGIWAFEPTHYFGHYLPDTFFFEK